MAPPFGQRNQDQPRPPPLVLDFLLPRPSHPPSPSNQPPEDHAQTDLPRLVTFPCEHCPISFSSAKTKTFPLPKRKPKLLPPLAWDFLSGDQPPLHRSSLLVAPSALRGLHSLRLLPTTANPRPAGEATPIEPSTSSTPSTTTASTLTSLQIGKERRWWRSRSKTENKSTICVVFLALQVTVTLTVGVGRQRRGRRSRSTGFVAFISGSAWTHVPPLFQHCSWGFIYVFFVISRYCCVYLDYCLGYFLFYISL